jgi:hypothetical protein
MTLLVVCPLNVALVSCQVTPVRLPPDELVVHAARIAGMRQRTKRKRHPNFTIDDIDLFSLLEQFLYLEV